MRRPTLDTRRTLRRSRRGNYATIFGLMIFAIIAMGALALDIAYMRMAQLQAQDIADAASQAALIVYRRTSDVDEAERVAQQVVQLNDVAGIAPSLGTVTFGTWDQPSDRGGVFLLDGDSPNAVHRNKTGWKDLQLPLYRHLAKEISALTGLDLSRVQLGYILLPRELNKTGFSVASWTEDKLAEADELMRTIIRGVRTEKFWPPASRAPKYSEKFAAICQDAVFEKYSIELDVQTAKVSP